MKNIMMILLDVGWRLFDNRRANLGLDFLGLAEIAFCIAIMSFVVAVISYLVNKNKDEQDRKNYKLPLKIGLIALLVCGVSLLLTSVLCSWWN